MHGVNRISVCWNCHPFGAQAPDAHTHVSFTIPGLAAPSSAASFNFSVQLQQDTAGYYDAMMWIPISVSVSLCFSQQMYTMYMEGQTDVDMFGTASVTTLAKERDGFLGRPVPRHGHPPCLSIEDVLVSVPQFLSGIRKETFQSNR